jgi:hypothetical protein
MSIPSPLDTARTFVRRPAEEHIGGREGEVKQKIAGTESPMKLARQLHP